MKRGIPDPEENGPATKKQKLQKVRESIDGIVAVLRKNLRRLGEKIRRQK